MENVQAVLTASSRATMESLRVGHAMQGQQAKEASVQNVKRQRNQIWTRSAPTR
eukprot:COSAG06_NODE_55724_length_288_cov_0.820106_2_plen_53_part_01